MSSGIYYNGVYKFEGCGAQYTSSVLSLGTFTTVVVFLIMSLAYNFVEPFIGLPYKMFVMMFIAILFSQASFFWAGQQRLQYKYKALIVVTLFNSLLAPILALFCIIKLGMGYEGVVYGYVISTLIFGGVLYVLIQSKGRTYFNKTYWHYSLQLSIPLIPHYLSLILLGQLSRIMVQYYCGPAIAGIYSLAYQVSLVMNLVIAGINSALTPWMYQNLKDGKYEVIKKGTSILVIFISFFSVVAMLISPEIVRLLGTEEYLQAVWIIPPVLLSTVLTFIYCIYGTVLFYYEKTRLVTIATTSGAIINVVLNCLFIPKYGFIAAAYTTLVSYLVLYLLYRYFTFRTCQTKNLIFGDIFDIIVSRLALLLLSILTIITLVFFLLPVYVRYIVIVMMLICSIKKQKVFINTLHNLKNKM